MKEILLFGKALAVSNLPFEKVNEIAMRKGYLVNEECCNTRVYDYLRSLPDDYNASFYKKWVDVTSKSRIELAFIQIRYYLHVYHGFDHESEPPADEIDFKEYKFIHPITVDEIQESIQKMFSSGVGLKTTTVSSCFDLIDEFDIFIDIDTIKNKEAMCLFADRYLKMPSNPEEIVRYIVYKYTNSTLLIKDKKTIELIKANPRKLKFDEEDVKKLASVFNRYKSLFLAMKSKNVGLINKLSKLSKKYHKPKEPGYWSTFLANQDWEKSFEIELKNLNNFKLISLLNTIVKRKSQSKHHSVLVRNQKIFVKENEVSSYQLLNKHEVLYNELLKKLRDKACKVILPKNIEIAAPISEKNFIGNIPIGSVIRFEGNNAILGIHRKKEHAAGFLDFSLLASNGVKYGWNSHFYSKTKELVFSGDIKDDTRQKEVSEMFYGENGFPNDILIALVNNYERHGETIYYNLFVAKEKVSHLAKNYLVDPNNIVCSIPLSTIREEDIIGFVANNSFYFINVGMGGNSVSFINEHKANYIKNLRDTADSYLKVQDVLSVAGFEFVEEDGLDLSDPSVLIDLFS